MDSGDRYTYQACPHLHCFWDGWVVVMVCNPIDKFVFVQDACIFALAGPYVTDMTMV